MLTLIKDEEFPRPYRLFRTLDNGEEVLWATYLIRVSALHQAQREADRLKEDLITHIPQQRIKR